MASSRLSTTSSSAASSNHPLMSLSAYPAKIIELANLTYNNKFSHGYSENIASIYKYTTALSPSQDEFQQFLRAIHNTLLTCDIYLKCLCFRIMRTCMLKFPAYCKVLMLEDIHHIVVQSLEKESDFFRERKEALKLIFTFLKADSKSFPISFGRSLIAIAGHAGDNMQIACVEVLRDLCICNTEIFVAVNGPKALMDVILDPDCEKIQGSLLLTFSMIYADPEKIKFMRLFSDLRYMLSPLTDVDIVPSGSETGADSKTSTIARWTASARVLVFFMRSYFGLIHLSSDNLCFPLIADILSVSKVPQELTNILLDSIFEICRPFITKYCASEKLQSNYGVSIATTIDPSVDGALRYNIPFPELRDNQQRQTSVNSATFPGETSFLSDKPERRKSIFDTIKSSSFFRKQSSFSSASSSSPSFSSSPKAAADVVVSSVNYSRNDALIQQIKMETHNGDVGEILSNTSKTSEKVDGSGVTCLTHPYCSLLCCSFIHSKLLDKLCHLSINGQQNIATKSRKLLINILRIIFNVFPKSMNVELLIFPSILDYATQTASSSSSMKVSPSKAFKAHQILQELSDVFSLTHFKNSYKSTNLMVYPFSFGQRERSLSNAGSDPFASSGPVVLERTSITMNEVCQNLWTISQGDAISTTGSVQHLGGSGGQFGGLGMSSKHQSISALEADMQPRMSFAVGLTDRMKGDGGSCSSLTPSQKLILNKELELSRIIGKEGKEPLKWDWIVILNTLNYGLHSTNLVDEALNSKWIKRLSGFYRCELDEKAYFVNTDWHPNNFIYTECAAKMYKILLEDSRGLKFLQEDRRGIFFDGLCSEIDTLVKEIVCKADNSTTQGRTVFRPWNCTYSLSREYFTILGRLLATVDGRKLLDTTNSFITLSLLGSHPQLDYLSRVVITSLSFSDHGMFSKMLFATWHSHKACSSNLKKYMYNLLMVILQSQPLEFYNWCVDLLLDFMSSSSAQDDILFNIFDLACQDKVLLKKIINTLSTTFTLNGPRANLVYSRFASIPEGIVYLTNKNLLAELIAYWKTVGCFDYKKVLHQNLNKSLLPDFFVAKNFATSAIVVESNRFSAFTISKSAIYAQQHQVNDQPSSLYIDAGAASADLEGFIKCPWTIEVKCCTQGMNSSSSVNKAANVGDYLKLDTFVDVSSYSHPIHQSASNGDFSRVIIIRGIVTNVNGIPEGRAITSIKGFISATLAVGACPFNKDGTIAAPIKFKPSVADEVPPPPSFSANPRDSIFANRLTQSGSSHALVDNLDAFSSLHDMDVPASFQNDNYFNWNDISPSNRRGDNAIMKDLDDEEDLFSVTVVGDPVVWIFSRKGPCRHPDYVDVFPKRPPTKGTVYLIEVQYHLKFKTDQSLFSPTNYHLYGQLCTTKEGAALLQKNLSLGTLLREARSVDSSFHVSSSALWALGHICSSDYGFNMVLNEDRSFLTWLTQNIYTHQNLNIRGVTYQALCMFSKSKVASAVLSDMNWESCHFGVTAVVIPRKVSKLFNIETVQGGVHLDNFTRQIPVNIPPKLLNLSPDSAQKFDSIEIEILSCIAKLPGIVKIFEKSKQRIEQIKMTNPQVFNSKDLYKAVLEFFELFPFRLSVRREVVGLFSYSAKSKDL